MKKTISIILVILILFSVIMIPNISKSDNVLGDLDNYKGKITGSSKLDTKVNKIFTVVRSIGMIITVIILMILGIKYMVGSIEERAEYKKSMIPYLIGAFLIFTGTFLPQLIFKIMQNN